MVTTTRLSALFCFLCVGLPGLAVAGTDSAVDESLAYTPSPVLEPLKGFVPYQGQGRDFPHSMEFNYLPLRALMVGPNRYEWKPLEDLLNDIARRRCQTVFRVYLEYPGRESGVPRFLLDGGLKTHTYINTNTQPEPPMSITTPDYDDIRLRKALQDFIRELGRRYDGDPRVGYITAGLLGTWGEWHTHPRWDLWASKAVQREVMDAYEASFHKTPVLVRYPSGENDNRFAENQLRRFGYHDDSFGFATLDTGRPEDDWFFLARMRMAGTEALRKWQKFPIGGEVRPELWPTLWTSQGSPLGQDFGRCIQETHAAWMMDSSACRTKTRDDRARAEAAARSLGYELYVVRVRWTSLPNGAGRLEVTMRNTGVAPFYHEWPVEVGLLGNDGKPHADFRPPWQLRNVIPGQGDCSFQFEIPREKMPSGRWQLALRVINPMPGGVPLRFANVTQDTTAPGWLTLATIAAPASASDGVLRSQCVVGRITEN